MTDDELRGVIEECTGADCWCADLSAEVLHLRAEVARLTAERDECAIYLKEGETPRQRMDRDHADTLSLMELLAKEKFRVKSAEADLATLKGVNDGNP